MSNMVTFKGANLPAVSTLSTALRSLETVAGPAGSVIIKMDKTGHWVFGADQTEVEDDARWAVNPFSFIHGYIAWGDGEVLGDDFDVEEELEATANAGMDVQPARQPDQLVNRLSSDDRTEEAEEAEETGT